jgi:hypothetical protein
MNDQQRSRSQVTVEDLLRVKRAERPSAEFWADFEKNLRAKQLAAIVQPRRQWLGWSWKSLARWTVPVGAAAVLGVTFINFNSGRSFSAKSPAALPGHELASASTVSSPEPVIVAPSAGVALSEPAKTLQVAAVSPTQNVPVQDAVVAAPVQTSTVSVAARNVELASVTEQIAGVAAAAQPVAVDAFPAGKSGTVSAAAEFGAFFDRAVAQLDQNLRPIRQPAQSTEPLAQLPSPRDARRARLLAFSASVDPNSPQYSSASNVVRSRERITSHLSDEALYDSIHRLGVHGNGVSIQF